MANRHSTCETFTITRVYSHIPKICDSKLMERDYAQKNWTHEQTFVHNQGQRVPQSKKRQIRRKLHEVDQNQKPK